MSDGTLFIRNRWFEDLPVGEFHVFGTHTFSEKEVIEFGKRYCPLPHYIDPEQAFATQHRGLVVPEWLIAATWMKLMVSYMERFATGVQDGRRNGAGVGINDMQWLQTVRPGHSLTYTYEIIEKPDRVVRNSWGIIRSRNEAFNQNNERVFSFEVDILAERNPQKVGTT